MYQYGWFIHTCLRNEVRESEEKDHEASIRQVSPSYFGTMKIPVSSGRSFDPRERDSAPRVIIINRAARRAGGARRRSSAAERRPTQALDEILDHR